MSDTAIEERQEVDKPHGRRPERLSRLGALAGALVAAGAMLLAAPGTAQAAGPSASLNVATASISTGTKPVVTYITADLPAGATIYLQRAADPGGSWQSVGRMAARSGTVRAPADPAGQYQYRILVTRGSATVITSSASDLTVTGPSGTSAETGGGCSACKVAEAVLPWLAPIVAPVIASVAQQIGSIILALLGAAFGV